MGSQNTSFLFCPISELGERKSKTKTLPLIFLSSISGFRFIPVILFIYLYTGLNLGSVSYFPTSSHFMFLNIQNCFLETGFCYSIQSDLKLTW